MLTRISYRSAGTAFVFAGLWFLLGLVLLWSPIPGALGIRAQMLVAWLFLLLLILGGSGVMLTMASYNGIFPSGDTSAPVSPPARADLSVTPDGQPMPWTQSPLPARPPPRPANTTAAVRSRPSEQPPASRGR